MQKKEEEERKKKKEKEKKEKKKTINQKNQKNHATIALALSIRTSFNHDTIHSRCGLQCYVVIGSCVCVCVCVKVRACARTCVTVLSVSPIVTSLFF